MSQVPIKAKAMMTKICMSDSNQVEAPLDSLQANLDAGKTTLQRAKARLHGAKPAFEREHAVAKRAELHLHATLPVKAALDHRLQQFKAWLGHARLLRVSEDVVPVHVFLKGGGYAL